MKARLILLIALSILLFILVNRNNQDLRGLILSAINPLKSNYKELANEIESKGQSYLMQKELIEKLQKENMALRKYLLDHTHYIRQVGKLFQKLPTLQKLPYKSVAIVDTISYVKLNKFDEITLTIPKKIKLKEKKVYGLIQSEVVAGVAYLDKGVLYGELISNPKCHFGVHIGKKRYPGIAEGVDKNTMVVRFIPKWADIKKGDRVETSGLDKIFFANIPVGIVTDVKIEEGYKSAYIQPYADTMHPGIFFLITDSTPYLVSYYDQNRSFPGAYYPYSHLAPKKFEENLSSVPQMVQTKELEVDPSEFEIPKEEKITPKAVILNKKKVVKQKEQESIKAPKRVNKPKPKPKPKHKPKPKKIVKKHKKDEIKRVKPQVQKPINVEPTPKPEPKKHPSPFDILRSGFF